MNITSSNISSIKVKNPKCNKKKGEESVDFFLNYLFVIIGDCHNGDKFYYSFLS